MQMGFAARREEAMRGMSASREREEIITDRYVMRDIGGRVFKFDTATGQTWMFEDNFVVEFGHRLRWVEVTDEAHAEERGSDGEDSGS